MLVSSRREYKKAVKNAELDYKKQKAISLMHASKCKDSKGFWKTWNKQNNEHVAIPINDPTLFANTFKANYVDSKNNVNSMHEFLRKCDEVQSKNSCDVEFDVNNNEEAVNQLHHSDALDYLNLNIFHILYAHPAVYVSLRILFNYMVKWGIVPSGFGYSVIIPIIKCSTKSLMDLNNYRPISIIPIVSKIFESCIACKFADLFGTHQNQFGFVKEGGCNKALFTFNSVVRYFNTRGSNVYCCSLDATKAFDRLNHFYLFSCMIDKGFPICIINCFVSWYRNLQSCVKCNNSVSDYFKVLSGTPQGSLLGGKFFNLTIDKLLLELDNLHLGCYINRKFSGAIAYADDLMLLSASVNQLKMMLITCYNFGIMCDLKYNCAKSFWALVGKIHGNAVVQFELDSIVIPYRNEIAYLGIDFTFGDTISVDCRKRIQKFLAAVSLVLQNKVHGYELVFASILITKCLPILSYGLDCLMLNSKNVNAVSKAWNTAFRWLFGLRKLDSTRLIFMRCNTMSLKYLLDCSLMCFYNNISNCANSLVHSLSTCVISEEMAFNSCFKRYNLYHMAAPYSIKSKVRSKFSAFCAEKL